MARIGHIFSYHQTSPICKNTSQSSAFCEEAILHVKVNHNTLDVVFSQNIRLRIPPAVNNTIWMTML